MNEQGSGVPRSSFPAGARCAHHPERDAESTCVRCGNYMCRDCISAQREPTCLACAARTGAAEPFPFNRDNYTLDGLLNLSLARFKTNWPALMLSALLFGMCVYLPNIAFEIAARSARGPFEASWINPLNLSGAWLAARILQQIVSALLSMAGSLVISGYFLDVLEARPTDLARVVGRLRALGAQLLALIGLYAIYLAMALPIVVAFFLTGGRAALPSSLLAPALVAVLVLGLFIYVSIGFTFVSYELAADPSLGALTAVRNSWELARGRRWRVAGVAFVGGVIAMSGLLACCVGVLFTFPIGMMAIAGMYLALKQPAQRAVSLSPEFPV